MSMSFEITMNDCHGGGGEGSVFGLERSHYRYKRRTRIWSQVRDETSCGAL